MEKRPWQESELATIRNKGVLSVLIKCTMIILPLLFRYLYTVLSDNRISSLAPPVLIACNKQDMTFSKGAKVIQSQLEKEM